MSSFTPNDLLASALEMGASRPALVSDAERFSYGQLYHSVKQAAVLLRNAGVAEGDRIAHLGCSSAAHVILLFATARIGAIYVPADPWTPPDALERMLRVASPGLVVLGDSLLGRPLAADRCCVKSPALSGLPHVDAAAGDWLEALSPDRSAAPEEESRDWPNTPELPHVMLFSSGTTGEPKGIVFSQRAMALQGMFLDMALQISPTERYLNVYQAGHYGGVTSFLQTVAAGATLIQLPVPQPGLVLQTIQERRVTFLVAVPALWRLILDHPSVAKADLSSLRMANIASDSIPVEMISEVMATTGAVSTQGYGLTEAGLVTVLPATEARSRLGSAGLPLPFARVRIRRNDGTVADRGEEGEIWVQTEYAMDGIWDGQRVVPPSGSAAHAFHKTNDLGCLDSDGYLYVTGRQEDFMKVSGYRVSPVEIEQAFRSHPAIADVAVVAIDHDSLGQAPVAVVVFKRGERASHDELVGQVSTELVRQAVPVHIGRAREIPRTLGTRKIRRKDVLERFLRGEYELVDA